MTLTADRRRCPRLPLRLAATVRRMVSGRTAETHTVDLSCGGIYLQANAGFAPEEQLEITLQLCDLLGPIASAADLRCVATVVRPDLNRQCVFACHIEDYTLELAPLTAEESHEQNGEREVRTS